MNEARIFSIGCPLSRNLNELRNLISKTINDDFSFLDQVGFPIAKDEENDYSVEDILINDDSLKIKGNDSPAATPFNGVKQIKTQKKIQIKKSQSKLIR